MALAPKMAQAPKIGAKEVSSAKAVAKDGVGAKEGDTIGTGAMALNWRQSEPQGNESPGIRE